MKKSEKQTLKRKLMKRRRSLICVLLAALLVGCAAPSQSVSSQTASAASVPESSQQESSAPSVSESSSQMPVSSQDLSFSPEYMRRTISREGYIDAEGYIHWNPDFIEKQLIGQYNLEEFADALQQLTEKKGAVSFCVSWPVYTTLVLWEDGTTTALKALFSPMVGPGMEISEEEWGTVTIEQKEDVAAVAAGREFGPYYVKTDGSVWQCFEEEQVGSSAMQISLDGVYGYCDLLAQGGTLSQEVLQELTGREDKQAAAEWDDIVQIMSYDMIVYALHEDGSLTRACKKGGQYKKAETGYPWPTEPVNIIRLFPGTGWYLTADGTLYHISTKNEYPQVKIIDGMQNIDQILLECDYALMQDGTVKALYPQAASDEALDQWLTSIKNAMTVTAG